MRRLAAGSLRIALSAVIIAVVAWSLAAIWIDGPKNRPLAAALCAVVATGSLLSLIMIRPWWWGTAAAVVPFAIVLAWWLSIAPSNTGNWQPDVAKLPSAAIEGNVVTIRNVRDFTYPSRPLSSSAGRRAPTTSTRSRGSTCFSPPGARAASPTRSRAGSFPTAGTWRSDETRKQVGEEYSALLGFFRQYELYYVVADERDVIGVRAGPRREDVHLYRIRGSPAFARAMLLDYLESVNRLARAPQWYNALTHNCTTTIRHHAQQVGAGNPFDWRILANGYLDELGYKRHQINTSMPFPELRRRSDITARARSAGDRKDFSALIRDGLPDRPVVSSR